MSHLICPGFPKSGTTTLHAMFVLSPGFEGPKDGKERNWFRTAAEPLPYSEVFTSDFSQEGTAFYECSPNYLSGRTRLARELIAKRIHAEVPDARILIAIRHPLSRAYSHYVHSLQRFARFGREKWTVAGRDLNDPYLMSLENAIATDPTLISDLAPGSQTYLELFGEDNVDFFFLESDIGNLAPFFARLRNSLGLEPDDMWETRRVPHANNSARWGIPQYFAAGTPSGTVETDEGTLELPPGTLYIASGVQHEVVSGIDPLQLRALHGASRLWSAELTLPMAERLFEQHFAADVEAFEALVRPLRPDMPDYLNMALKPKTMPLQAVDAEFLNEAITNK